MKYWKKCAKWNPRLSFSWEQLFSVFGQNSSFHVLENDHFGGDLGFHLYDSSALHQMLVLQWNVEFNGHLRV